jgi:DNA-binding NarL/FixJ family response regulator
MKASSKAAGKVIRILLADDHPVVREGLVSILKAKDIQVIGEASDERKHAGFTINSPRIF